MNALKLKVIRRSGVDLDNIDLEVAKEHGIKVVNSPRASSRSVAKLAMALMFNVTRKVAFADRKIRRDVWIKKQCMGIELRGRTLGIVSFGRIGYEVAKIAKVLEMNLFFYDPYPNEESKMKSAGNLST